MSPFLDPGGRAALKPCLDKSPALLSEICDAFSQGLMSFQRGHNHSY